MFTFLKRSKILLEMSIVLAISVSLERNANLLTVIEQLRDPLTVVESVQPGCLFTIFPLRYRST